MTKNFGVMVCGHGSRDAGAVAEFEKLAVAIRDRADGTPVYMEYLPRAPIARSAAALSLRADR